MSDPALDDLNAIPGLTPDLQHYIRSVAANLGLDPVDVALAMYKETAWTYDPQIWGGLHDQYYGLIQFGPDAREDYGVTDQMPLEEQVFAVQNYLRAHAGEVPVPGMALPDIYSTILTGAPGNFDRPDVNGTVPFHVGEMEAQREAVTRAMMTPEEIALRETAALVGVTPAQAAEMQHQQMLFDGGYATVAADGTIDWNHAEDQFWGDQVADLQRRLWLAGYDPGPIDGNWGANTQDAWIDRRMLQQGRDTTQFQPWDWPTGRRPGGFHPNLPPPDWNSYVMPPITTVPVTVAQNYAPLWPGAYDPMPMAGQDPRLMAPQPTPLMYDPRPLTAQTPAAFRPALPVTPAPLPPAPLPYPNPLRIR